MVNTNNGYHKTTLENGLRIITIPMPGVKSVTAMVIVGAGSRYEEKRTNGLSHFLEHMAFKGTVNRPSALIISSEIDSLGGEFNAYTSKDHTAFYIKARAAHSDHLLEVLSDMLLNSLFKEEEIEREKGVIIEEINMYEDTPMRKIGDIYEQHLYGDHPLGWEIAGTRESVTSVTRQDFLSYVDAVYAPNNTVVVVAGGVEAEDVEKTVSAQLGRWQKRETRKFELIKDDKNPGNKPQVHLTHKKTEQVHIALGVRAYPMNHAEKYAQGLLAAILGGGMSSRLFIEVRERRGLCYYVRAENSRYSDVGNFVVQAGIDKTRIDDAIKVIIAELAAIADGTKPVENAELSKVKEYLKGRLVLDLEDSRSVAGLFGTQEILLNKVVTPEESMAKIDRVTAREIEKVARDLFVNQKLNLAIIGPYKEADRFKNLLSF